MASGCDRPAVGRPCEPAAQVVAVPVERVPPGAVVALEVGGRRLALWRTASGRPVVVDARCPHQWADLPTEGRVEGDELVCGAHGWCFDAEGHGAKRTESGRVDPKADVATVPVRRVGDQLLVEVDASGPAQAEPPGSTG